MKSLGALAITGFCLNFAHAGNLAADAHLQQGLAEYENGHYAVAARHFRDAAANGDTRAPEILALMFRYGERLYGNQFAADTAEAARWATLAVERRSADGLTTTPPSR